MELRETILQGTLQVFNVKGLKFTMDDIASTLGMSKKTIYTVFNDKEELFLAMVDYLFDSIKEGKEQVMNNHEMTTLEKIKAILKVMPEGYKDVDFRQLYLLKDKYPKIYSQVENRLETGWESTIALFEQGMREGVVRKISIPILKMMLEASLEQFFQRDILVRNQITYMDALDEVVGILVNGIEAR
ncbi:MAG: TetR/AcrR family transcriptional regulator [Lachnospiraceae bacterium]|nr:TetR/AcrR family transcriptional regulator [Lachnospiraceae bacterium]